MLNQRGEALAARLTAPAGRGVSDVADFLLLQSINRWQKLPAHWADTGRIHPAELYATLVQMAGEFATFTETTRRPNAYPSYWHEDLRRSFAPVVADLRRSLSALPVAPRQIPFHAGASYFELDRDSPHWRQMQASGGFAIHVSGEFPNLRLEFWAIRG